MRFGTVFAIVFSALSTPLLAQEVNLDKKLKINDHAVGLNQLVEYLLVPVSYAKEFQCQGDSLYNLVSAKYVPKKAIELQRFNATVDFPFIQLVSYQASTLAEDELLCYRCCFGKVDRKDCGIFISKFGDQSWAPNCPKS
jgi:hypothetical protein